MNEPSRYPETVLQYEEWLATRIGDCQQAAQRVIQRLGRLVGHPVARTEESQHVVESGTFAQVVVALETLWEDLQQIERYVGESSKVKRGPQDAVRKRPSPDQESYQGVRWCDAEVRE